MLSITFMICFMFIFSTPLTPYILMIMTLLSLNKLIMVFDLSFIMMNSLFYDHMSGCLVVLTLWISSMMMLASMYSSFNKTMETLTKLILLLLITLIIAFFANNMMMYYIFFEASLIPTLMIILGWGYQPERIQASMYLMLYTISASLPLLFLLIMHNYSIKTLYMMSLYNKMTYSMFVSVMFMLAFMVKMPMYISHLWLPKAHVEAPVAGSMILAGVLLKLGAYGILRISYMMKNMMLFTQNLFISISMWGAVVTSFICIRQQDMKSLIAYSSVSHMALVIAALMSLTKLGMEGSIILMIGHGLASPALFALANISYEINKTRSLFLAKGMLFLFPVMSVWWFMSSISNMAAPPTLNLVGEILLMMAVIYNNNLMAVFFAASSFLAAGYSLILYTSTNHGKPMSYSMPNFSSYSRNSLLMLFQLSPLFFMSLIPCSLIFIS